MDGTDGQAAPSASSQAVTALVLGVLGLACCQLLSPIAWFLGNQEVRAIREGRSPQAGQSIATVAVALGIGGTILMLFILLWIVFFGGLAFLSAMMQSHR
jgi:hypothetical protein